MRTLGTTLHTLAAAALIAAIWSPIGAWWQYLATALLLFLAGAAIHGGTQLANHTPNEKTKPDTGHGGYTTDEIADKIAHERAKRRHLNYGQKAN